VAFGPYDPVSPSKTELGDRDRWLQEEELP
jgi:hypothetical protein